MIANVSRSGTSYSLNDQRMYDVWGAARTGSSTGDPKGRYCANLGHVQDDESGFIYMRARYYDQSRGRFLSEDPSNNGSNWYSYCISDPIGYHDSSGKEAEGLLSNEGVFLAFVGLIKHCYEVGTWGWNHPNQFSAGRAAGALLLDTVMTAVSVACVSALITGAVGCLALTGPLGIAAAVICVAMALALVLVTELAMDEIDDSMVYSGGDN